jgi:hypothetical protein
VNGLCGFCRSRSPRSISQEARTRCFMFDELASQMAALPAAGGRPSARSR